MDGHELNSSAKLMEMAKDKLAKLLAPPNAINNQHYSFIVLSLEMCVCVFELRIQ